jgi:translation initiation factor 3 subunit G
MSLELKPDYKKEIIPPDKDNIKTVIEYYRNDNNQLVKRTTKFKVTKRIIRMKESVYKRRQWAKFGECQNVPKNYIEPGVTIITNEDIKLNVSQNKKIPKLFKKEDTKIKCRHCNENHWSSKCKNKTIQDKPKEEIKSNKYIPPHLKRKSNNEIEYTVKLSNLPYDMIKQDLYEFIKNFGRTERVHLVTDRKTNKFKGLAFITFYKKNDGQEMIDKLNKYKYGRMILLADWAKQKNNYSLME